MNSHSRLARAAVTRLLADFNSQITSILFTESFYLLAHSDVFLQRFVVLYFYSLRSFKEEKIAALNFHLQFIKTALWVMQTGWR